MSTRTDNNKLMNWDSIGKKFGLRGLAMLLLIVVLLGATSFAQAEGNSGGEEDEYVPVARFVDPAGVDEGSCTDQLNPCATINYALSQSGRFDIINVAPGVYHENIQIGESVTLAGAGADVTVIDGDTDGDGLPNKNAIAIWANKVTIKGFEIRHGWNGIYGHTIQSIIKENVIHDNIDVRGVDGAGIKLWGFSGENLIQGNVVYNNDQQGILIGADLWQKDPVNNLVANNVVFDNGVYRTGAADDQNEVGIQLYNTNGNIVQNNEIFGHSKTQQGVGVMIKQRAEGNAVYDNEIYGNSIGVSLRIYTADNYLSGNIIHDNLRDGVRIDDSAYSALINFNQFCRNGEYGVNYHGFAKSGVVIDATFNWWGSVSGPGMYGPGTGDDVTAGVQFYTWNHVPPNAGPCHTNAVMAHKYFDVDMNGEMGPYEPGVNGWEMTLYNEDGEAVMSTRTQTLGYQEGWALFEDVPAGNYMVCETLIDGWVNSDPGEESLCQPVVVAEYGPAPGTGSLFAFFDHPGDDEFRYSILGVDSYAIAQLVAQEEELTEEMLLSHVSESWLCVLSQLASDDPEVIQDVLADEYLEISPHTLINWDVAYGFDTELYSMMVESDLFMAPMQLGVKSWRGTAGYSTATGFVQCGFVPTVVFGNYAQVGEVFVSSNSQGEVGGMYYEDEDILYHDAMSGNWQQVFDGSDVLPKNNDVDAFHMMEDGSILLSLEFGTKLDDLGKVDDADILRFVPASLGANTAGVFELYFDGSSVGLNKAGEDVDSIAFLPDGRLVVSTLARHDVPGATGNVHGGHSDLLAFDADSGTWETYFDALAAGMYRDDIWGTWVDPTTGDVYVSFQSGFAFENAAGGPVDIVVCNPTAADGSIECDFGPGVYWDGSAYGYPGHRLDGIFVVPLTP